MQVVGRKISMHRYGLGWAKIKCANVRVGSPADPTGG